MNTKIDSYHDLPAPTVLATSYYIDPNQFAGDDARSEEAAFDNFTDCQIETEAEARKHAQRLANYLDAPVKVDRVATCHPDRKEFELAFTVQPNRAPITDESGSVIGSMLRPYPAELTVGNTASWIMANAVMPVDMHDILRRFAAGQKQ